MFLFEFQISARAGRQGALRLPSPMCRHSLDGTRNKSRLWQQVKLAQGRAEQHREAAQTALAQLAERSAECEALQEQLSSMPPPPDGRDANGAAEADSGRSLAELEASEQELSFARQECAGLHGEVSHLQEQLGAAQSQLRRLRQQQQQPGPQQLLQSPQHGAAAMGAAHDATGNAAAAAAATAAAEEAAVTAQRAEWRLREKVAELEKEAPRLRKAARAAEAALAKAQAAAAQERERADDAERQLLSQVRVWTKKIVLKTAADARHDYQMDCHGPVQFACGLMQFSSPMHSLHPAS